MKRLLPYIFLLLSVLPGKALAASNPYAESFASDAMRAILGLASISCAFFLIRGGYMYITSTGNPSALDEAKRTIKNAFAGLIIVIGAAVFSSLLSGAFNEPATGGSGAAISMSPIVQAPGDSSLTQILLDAITGFLKNIVQSATRPIIDAVTGFLTNTPMLSTNSVVFNFWLVMVGIVDSLFVVVIALLGLQVMSATTFGFEEITFKELLPRIGLAFLMANTSIFLIDWIVSACQMLVTAVLNSTGGIGGAWIMNAFDPATLLSGGTTLVTLIFLLVFLVLSAVLLLFYISRMMVLAFGAAISPFVCLLWLLPKWSEFASGAFKAYMVAIFSVFIHVVIIQLSCAFLTVPGQAGTDPFISILIGIALFSILLKSTALTFQLTMLSQTTGGFKKIGGQLLNVMGSVNHPAPVKIKKPR